MLYKIDFWFKQAQAGKQSVKNWVEGRIVAFVGQQEIEDLLIQSAPASWQKRFSVLALGYLHSPAKIHHTWASEGSKSSPLFFSIFIPFFLSRNLLSFSLHWNFNIFMATEVLFSKCPLKYDKSVLPVVSPPLQGYSSKKQLLPWRHFWPMCTHGQGGRIPPWWLTLIW